MLKYDIKHLAPVLISTGEVIYFMACIDTKTNTFSQYGDISKANATILHFPHCLSIYNVLLVITNCSIEHTIGVDNLLHLKRSLHDFPTERRL